MSPEQSKRVELTAEQLEIAEMLLEDCGLTDLADVEMEMMGETGTIRYGLGRCAQYLLDKTPEEIREIIMTKVATQPQNARLDKLSDA